MGFFARIFSLTCNSRVSYWCIILASTVALIVEMMLHPCIISKSTECKVRINLHYLLRLSQSLLHSYELQMLCQSIGQGWGRSLSLAPYLANPVLWVACRIMWDADIIVIASRLFPKLFCGSFLYIQHIIVIKRSMNKILKNKEDP